MNKGYFQDEHGNNSMMRLLSFITLLTGVILILGGETFRMFVNITYEPDTVTGLALFSLGLAAKWAQKKDENNKQQ